MLNKSFVKLVSLVILNCLGSGLIMLPPRLAKLGLSSFVAWILTGIGAFSIGMIFIRLGEERNGSDYYLHNLISYQAKGTLRKLLKYVFFWEYLIFGILGNAVLSCTIVAALAQVFPDVAFQYGIVIHAFLFFLFYLINRFGVNVSENFERIFTIIKLLILVLFPLLIFIFVKPSLRINIALDPLQDTIKGMFITIWPFVGIESISMETGFDRNSMRYAMIAGVLICLGTFLLNTYVMMTHIPNLANSSSAYSDLFGILFGNHTKWIVNALIILVVLGSLHGWTHTALSTIDSGEALLPKYLIEKNKYNVNEMGLMFVSILPLLFIIITQFFLRSPHVFDVIIDTVTSMCLLIYASGVVAFAFALIKMSRKKIADCFYVIFGLIYSIFALYGSPILATGLAMLSIIIFSSIYFINARRKI